jgi:hypothetical protein
MLIFTSNRMFKKPCSSISKRCWLHKRNEKKKKKNQQNKWLELPLQLLFWFNASEGDDECRKNDQSKDQHENYRDSGFSFSAFFLNCQFKVLIEQNA